VFYRAKTVSTLNFKGLEPDEGLKKERTILEVLQAQRAELRYREVYPLLLGLQGGTNAPSFMSRAGVRKTAEAFTNAGL